MGANRPADAQWFEAVAAEARDEADADERNRLRAALVEGSPPGSGRWLAGEILEYHRREARPGWWWHFERRDRMTEEDLLDDAEAIAGLAPCGKAVADKKSLLHTLAFPPQQHKFGPGDQPVDPATKEPAATVAALDDVAGTLTRRRGATFKGVALPRALVPSGPYSTVAPRGALARLAASILAGWIYPVSPDGFRLEEALGFFRSSSSCFHAPAGAVCSPARGSRRPASILA